jgi:hypothetical protein
MIILFKKSFSLQIDGNVSFLLLRILYVLTDGGSRLFYTSLKHELNQGSKNPCL